MFVQQFFVKGIAHSSYILAGKEKCAVIDPRRDTGIYVEAAKVLGVKITHILETHLHADFISGHIDLAEATGAKIYAPKSGNCEFEHVGLSEGDSFEIEDMEVRVMETPGHTTIFGCGPPAPDTTFFYFLSFELGGKSPDICYQLAHLGTVHRLGHSFKSYVMFFKFLGEYNAVYRVT